MGYTTDFSGEFAITPPLTPEQSQYINAFSDNRRISRHVDKLAGKPDPIREAVGLPIGEEGAYYIGEVNRYADNYRDPCVINYNTPPVGQPGLWCQWVVEKGGAALVWDEGEKFYSYTEWLEYIIEHFLKPWGRELNGEVEWRGESPDDRGTIYASKNRVQAVADSIQNPGPDWEAVR